MTKNNPNTISEIWKEIPGFPGYEVSNRGRVRSFWRRGKAGRGQFHLANIPQKIVQPGYRSGYLFIKLFKEGNRFIYSIHRLVLLVFTGSCPPGMESCHNDGIRTNNFFENLRWDTPANNDRDIKKHGTRKGIKNHRARLNNVQVIQIREMASQGHFQREIAKKFSVHQGTISRIVLHKNWNHI